MTKPLINKSTTHNTNAKKTVFSLSLIMILTISAFIAVVPLIPLITSNNPQPPTYEEITTPVRVVPTVAGEPNFTGRVFPSS